MKHTEKTFEDEVVAHLTNHGWLLGQSADYDRERALYPEDVFGWLADTQPAELAKIDKLPNGRAAVLTRLGQVLDQDGALHILRTGFKHISARFAMCQFAPAQALNATTVARFGQVRCRVVRQLRYSLHHQNTIDLVLFVNGIPVATVELKTDFTQSVEHAIAQYKADRLPKDPATHTEEPLLAFKRRALVHFAVSTDAVAMTTRLDGQQTNFLPFNLGNNGGAGNPVNPQGYRTAYLWERVLERTSWLGLLQHFAHLHKTPSTNAQGKRITTEHLIFPRLHQWDVVNQLVAAARTEGPGQTYLIQHSAGSGKSNSIAWLAHRLAHLHTADNHKVFDSVIVVTDRTVLDAQLQETVAQFEQTAGVVTRIDHDSAKSAQLAKALGGQSPIIIVTLQTFPFVLAALQSQPELHSRTFAVIADEAHSSQTGAAATALSAALASSGQQASSQSSVISRQQAGTSSAGAGTSSAGESGTDAGEGEISIEDVLLHGMAARATHSNVSYFAFTATPKAKTLQRFGRRPDPTIPASDTNLPAAFHVYSMQQAIEEGFILDVLQNYTPYRLAFKLAHNGKDYDEATVDEAAARTRLLRWVRLHPYNISQKVQIIVEHFREHVQPLLGGHAKAMVVTDSRQAAVRYKLAMDAYLQTQGYGELATLVAFSGEVHDAESGLEPFSEASMNTGLRGRDIRSGLATDDYQVLIVANKFQTGFDQPLLCAMYVDKRLDGIAAVQTLSRLNRTAPGKDRTYVIDFVNQPADILAAFQPYYRTASLTSVTDPNLLHTLQGKLDGQQIYTAAEIESFVAVLLDPRGKQAALQAQIAPAVERFRDRWAAATAAHDKLQIEALELFRSDVAAFVRLYDFLSHIVNYEDADLERRALFFRHLLPLLLPTRLAEPLDLSGVVLTHYKLKSSPPEPSQLKEDGATYGLAAPGAVGSGTARDAQQVQLAALIAQLNGLFDGELSDGDLISYANHIQSKLLANPKLKLQATSNSKAQFALGDFQSEMMTAVADGLENYQTMATQVLDNPKVRAGLAAVLLDLVYDGLRQPATAQ